MRPVRLLIVDDDIEDQELFIEAVKEVDASIECHSAYNGQEALEHLNNTSVLPDYIFMDLNMPVIDGMQCLKEIKKNDSLRHIPVCIYTTSNWSRNKEESLELGARHFFTKPVRFHEICKQISSVLREPPANRSADIFDDKQRSNPE